MPRSRLVRDAKEALKKRRLVIPAQAGIQKVNRLLDARFRGHDVVQSIPKHVGQAGASRAGYHVVVAHNLAPAMSRIDTPAGHRYPWYVRVLLAIQRRRYGRELEPSRLWGRTPLVFAALSLLYGALDRKRSPIEPALRSLVAVHVSRINWCAFCVDINSASGLQRGVSEDQLASLAQFDASPLFGEREKAALAYAEAMTLPERRVDDALMARLKRHFHDDAVIELTALIAYQNLSSKFNDALGVAPQGFCDLPSASASSTSSPRKRGSGDLS